MDKIDIKAELDSPDYKVEFNRTLAMRTSMSQCLLFCYMNTSRHPESAEKNFMLRLIDDIIQSVISMEYLGQEGFMNICKRELRYLIELALKANFIVNSSDDGDFDSQVKKFEKLLNSSNINPVNDLQINYLDTDVTAEFKTDVKRLYGFLCKYVHASTHQIQERIAQVMMGRSIGFEGTAALAELNGLLERSYVIVLVFLFNSIPQYVVGDFLVGPDGGINAWYFSQSKYISLIDAKFDYKHERQHILEDLAEIRAQQIRF